MTVQLYAIEYAPGRFHSGGSKTGTNVALYDAAGANRIIGRYKERYPDVKRVAVAFGLTQEHAEELEDTQLFMDCLEGAGVDNWHGYEYAQEAYREVKGEQDEV